MNKILHRNYCSDKPGMYLDLYVAICKGFDILQHDKTGVSKDDMFKFVMKEMKGHVNPSIVLQELDKFEE